MTCELLPYHRRTRVVICCPWFFRGDAVGAAARESFLALAGYDRYDVTALWTLNDYDDVSGRFVPDVSALLLDPSFLAADVIIYVFAVYHEYFDSMLIGNGHAKIIVRFHNVTPRKFMPDHLHEVIDRSFAQIQNFRKADEIWADSQENEQELLRQGISADTIKVVPLSVDFPVRRRLSDKPIGRIELLYIGRFFASKGVLDIVIAADELRRMTRVPFRLTLGGNLRFSDADYVAQIQALIVERNLADIVDFRGTVSHEDLVTLYSRSHIFVTGSRHEGFCVPVIEGLAAGCVPISYAISNLRFIAGGLGRLAHTDTPRSLADALMQTITALADSDAVDRTIVLDGGEMNVAAFDAAADAYVAGFTSDRFSETLARRVRTLTLESVLQT